MEKLVDLLGTQYIAEYFGQQVHEIVEQHSELDLAGAKLTPRISDILTEAMSRGKVFRNSENPELDNILLENMARAAKQYTTQPLPLPKSMKDVVETIKYLPHSTPFHLEGDSRLTFPFAVLVQIYSPNVQIDLGSNCRKFYKYITESLYRKNLELVVQTTNEYTICVGTTICPVTITEKDIHKEFRLELTGLITWNALATMYQILPSYFGVVKTQKDETLRPLWEPVIKRSMADLETYFENSSLTIKSFLEGDQ